MKQQHPLWAWGWLPAALTGIALTTVPIFSSSVEIQVYDDAVKIGSDGRIFSHIALDGYEDSNPAWDGKAIRLAGARGETVSFQIAIRADYNALPDVDVRASDLKSSAGADPEAGSVIPASQIARFRQWYITVTLPSETPAASTGPGAYPDPLIPADIPEHGLPITVLPRQVQGIWLDVAIPRQAAAGVHSGTVTVVSGQTTLAQLDIHLEVHDFTLPRERHMRFRVGYGEFGHFLKEHENIGYTRETGKESQEFRDREAQLYRLVWSHRLAPTTHYLLPVPTTTGTGADLQIDWTAYDQRFAGYLDGTAFDDGVPLNIFSLPVNLQASSGWPASTRIRHTKTAADLDVAAIQAAVTQTVAHWKERGWPLDNAFIYLADEPKPERYDIIDAACKAIRAASPEVPISIAFWTEFGPRAKEIVERYQGCVTQWDIAGDYMNLPALEARRAAGDSVGFYQGSEPFQGSEALDGDGLSMTTWPWIAWRYRLDTLFLYNMTEWSYFRLDKKRDQPWSDYPRDIWTNPLNQSWQTNNQGVLIYPGHKIGFEGVIPSIRLKQIRRGMQDYEYLWLASQKGKRAQADAVAKKLVPKALHEAAPGWGIPHNGLGAWERDPRAWDRARRDLARAIIE